MLTEELKQSLTDLLGPGQVVTDPAELITYEIDAGLDRGLPDAVILPHSVADVCRIVRWAAGHRVPLVARGAGTGLSGGAVAEHGGLIIEFARMNRILAIDPAGRSAVVEPGVLNQALDGAARAYGLYYPPDPASGRSSTLGGNVAENAGGPHCFKYGVTTNYVTGLEVVLADGRRVRLGGRALDYPEYDFCGLVTGSEGTLALVTQVSVRLIRNPPGVKTLMAAFHSVEQAGRAVSAVIAAGLVPATLEMMDQKIMRIVEAYVPAGLPVDAGAALIVEVDGYPAGLDAQIDEVAHILQRHGAFNLRIARTAEERERIWFGRKSAAGAISRLAPAYYLVDVTVPRSRLAEMLAEVNRVCDVYELRVGYVFHAGDGNLHPLILLDPRDEEMVQRVQQAGREIVELCVARDGSITGEHGVGLEKREYMPLMYTGAELAAMWDVKHVFDPQGLLNPGKVFPAQMPPVTKVHGEMPPDTVFTPASAEEAAGGLAALAAVGRRVRIGNVPASHRGGGTVCLSTVRLRGITAYAREDFYVTVNAGTPLAEVQAFLAADGMQVPLASPWPEATVGGLVAANVNGPLRMRYGSVRDLVLCARVALTDGRVIRAGRPVVKNVAGYDLVKVFVGSHGTLGLIADVTLRVTPLPRARRTLLVPVENLVQGLNWASQVLPLALVASALVVCGGCDLPTVPDAPCLLAYTAEGLPEDVDAELAEVTAALRRAGAPRPAEVEAPTGTDLWAHYLNSAGADGLVVRVGVPPKDLAAYVRDQTPLLESARPLLDVAAGLVYAVRPAGAGAEARAWVEALRQPALAAEGYAVVMSMPEELHAVLDPWGYRPEALDLMRDLKARWDPAGILSSNLLVWETGTT